MQLDVFTLVPHAYSWLTEQRPVATVLGSELDLRLFSYRDTTPLKAGQIWIVPRGIQHGIRNAGATRLSYLGVNAGREPEGAPAGG